MKKIFILLTLAILAISVNAQVSAVAINGNGDYKQYVDTLLVPVDSTIVVNSLGIVSDITITYDTIYKFNSKSILGINTTTCISQRHILDTTYMEYDTFYSNIITAIPDDGWVFVNWIIVSTEDGSLFVDTIFDASFCTDLFKPIVFIDLNFEKIVDSNIIDGTKKCNVNIYPNPTTQFVNVDGDFDYLVVYNIRGKRIYRGTLSYFDMQRCSPGVYTFIIVKDGYSYTYKVVKQ